MTPRNECTQRCCSIDDCEREHYGRGWCERHYRQWKRSGDPEGLKPRVGMTLDPFWARVDARGCCWEFRTTDLKGYGSYHSGGVAFKAHRYAWELLIGPIPEGLVLDHLCRNARCVNPDHLEPVTQAENVLRGFGWGAQNARKVVCKRGHNDWRVRPDGRRVCSTCVAAAELKRGAA